VPSTNRIGVARVRKTSSRSFVRLPIAQRGFDDYKKDGRAREADQAVAKEVPRRPRQDAERETCLHRGWNQCHACYQHRAKDPEFAAAWLEAIEHSVVWSCLAPNHSTALVTATLASSSGDRDYPGGTRNWNLSQSARSGRPSASIGHEQLLASIIRNVKVSNALLTGLHAIIVVPSPSRGGRLRQAVRVGAILVTKTMQGCDNRLFES